MAKWGTVAGVLVGCLAILAFASGAQAQHTTFGCSACHIPHHASLPTDKSASWGVPLWNPANMDPNGLPTFTLYSSDTLPAQVTNTITQPSGASKLCLGCHDGSYIYFQTNSTPYVFGAADLARSHPISFTYDSSLAQAVPRNQLNDPSVALSTLGGTIQHDLLDSHNQMQCTSCHDVHATGIGAYMLRYPYVVGSHDNQMCVVCHNK